VSNASWSQLDSDLDALLDLDPATREARLQQIAQSDPDKALALRRWLSSIDQSAGMLETRAAVAPGGSGPWRALEIVGRGGMGEVWRGERSDGAFERSVAIKFLRVDRAAAGASIGRERVLLARLRHPGLAQLLDGGVSDDGRPWLVTEWVEGLRLDRWIEERRPVLRARVQLLLRLAEAVAYAHSHLIVHRDLKPANVMVDAEGMPRLLDFGIARLLDEANPAMSTLEGAMTPAFAAPEQLRGEPVDTRTDVYALGALLHFVVTGKSRFDAGDSSLAALVERVCHQDAKAPSECAADAGIDADLDAITLTALARDPAQRYASAEALAADLRHWLAGEAVSTRLPTRGERLRRFVRSHRVETALVAALILALTLGVATTTWQAMRAESARRSAVNERDAALAEVDRSEHLIDTFARLFREAEGDEKLSASEWLDRAAAVGSNSSPDETASQTRLLAKLAAIEQDRGQHARAAKLLERVLAAPAAALPPAEWVDVHCRLGAAHKSMGDTEAALSAFAEGVGIAERLTGTARLGLIDCLSERAGMPMRNGVVGPADFEAGERALRELDLITASGDLRWRRANVLYVLATLHDLASHPDQAAHYYQQVLDIDRALGNTESPDHAALLTSHAGSLQRVGDLRGAETQFETGIAIYRRFSGRHPSLATNIANLATVKNLLGKYSQAEALAREALIMIQAIDGENPPAAGNAAHALGVALREQGRYPESLAAFDAATRNFSASDSTRGVGLEQRMEVARALATLASGDGSAAAKSIQVTLATLRAQSFPRILIEALLADARIQRALGKPQVAVASAREALGLMTERMTVQHPTRADAMLELALALADSGASDEARKLLDQAEPVLRQRLGADHPRTREARVLTERL
jgi:tetratricopeptide (TPR) repeat protein